MTAGQLLADLMKVDPQLDLLVAVGGEFVPLHGIAFAPGSPYGVIHGHGKRISGARFTIDEQGVLGKLAGVGLTDEQIGNIMGRPTDAIKRKRKAMGLPDARM